MPALCSAPWPYGLAVQLLPPVVLRRGGRCSGAEEALARLRLLYVGVAMGAVRRATANLE
jgi:hypothetical protein